MSGAWGPEPPAPGPTVVRIAHPNAHRPHRCCECASAIATAQRYERTDGLWEGRWEHYVTCEPCVELRSTVSCGDGWVYGELAEASEEWYRGWSVARTPDPERRAKAQVGRMVAAMRRRRRAARKETAQ